MSLCASVHHWTFFAHVVVIVAIAIFVAEPKVVDEDSPSFSLSIRVIDDTVCSLAPEDHGLSLTLSMTSPHPTLISSFPKFPQTHTHSLSLSLIIVASSKKKIDLKLGLGGKSILIP